MKKIFPLFAGFAFLLAFGLAYADDSKAAGGMSDKVITNDDLPQGSSDQDNSTFNRMPAGSGIEGSGAGGVSNDSDSLKKDSGREKEPAEQTPVEPGRKEPGADKSGMDTYRSNY